MARARTIDSRGSTGGVLHSPRIVRAPWRRRVGSRARTRSRRRRRWSPLRPAARQIAQRGFGIGEETHGREMGRGLYISPEPRFAAVWGSVLVELELESPRGYLVLAPVGRANYVMALGYARRLDEVERLTQGIVARPDSDIGTWWMGLCPCRGRRQGRGAALARPRDRPRDDQLPLSRRARPVSGQRSGRSAVWRTDGAGQAGMGAARGVNFPRRFKALARVLASPADT